MGFHKTFAMDRGDSLGAGTETTEAAEDIGTGLRAFTGSEVGTVSGTTIAFSIRLCTLEGSMTCWLSSGGGVGPRSGVLALH